MSKKPNILFIISDQFRWDCLSIAGHPTVETPNLDDIASSGVRFTNAYSSCPSCIAARASIFTGKNPDHTGFLGYEDCNDWDFENMLPQMLRDDGYQTHCVGKTHFYPQRKHCGFEGLDSYEASQNLDGDYVNDYFEWVNEKTDGKLHERDLGLGSNSWMAKPSLLPEELHNNTWVVEKGMDFIRRRDKTRPYFLNLSFVRPHPPIDPPKEFWDMYKDIEIDSVPIGNWSEKHDVEVTDPEAWHGKLETEDLRKCRMGYYAQIAHIDMQIGRMIEYLEQFEESPDMIIFTSDHGEMLGDHNMFRKTYAYEGSAAVPLIIKTTKSDAHIVRDEPVVLEDIYATILGFAGTKLPSEVDSIDLNPLLSKTGAISREWVHGEHSSCYSEDEAMQFITDGVYKYIWFTATGREQLFNLVDDPYECDDLSGKPIFADELTKWRDLMIQRLATRPQDGLSDGERLIKGVIGATRK